MSTVAEVEDSDETTNSWKSRLVKFVKELNIHTEPIVLMISLCNGAKNVLQPHLSEAKMRRSYQPPAALSPAALIKFYNKKMVLWEQNYTYVNVPIACFIGLFYGAYSDRKGRKWPILLGILSNLLDCIIRTLVWWDMVDLDLRWLLVDAAINGLLGGTSVIMMNAYMVDKFHKKSLSVRMILFSAIFSLGALLGVQVSSVSIHFVSHIAVMFIIQVILFFAFVFAIPLLDNDIPQKSEEENQEENFTSSPSIYSLMSQGFKDLQGSMKVFTRLRPHHGRLLLGLCFFLNFLDQIIFSEEMELIGIYTRLPPFYWDTQQYTQYKTFRPIAQIMGMFFGLVVLKQFFCLKDISMIVLSILSMGAAAVAIALANSSLLIYLSLAAGCLHGLLNPLAYTFLALIVFQDEVGKSFALTTIASKASGIVQSLVLQNIYMWTIDWNQAFIWYFLAGLSLFSASVYGLVGIWKSKDIEEANVVG